MLKYLIEKEFKQMRRNTFLPKLIILFPCMIMLLMPWAASLEIKNIRLCVVDADHSALSRRLVQKVSASTYFLMQPLQGTYDEALHEVEEGRADIILELPRGFEKSLLRGESPRILVAANAVNGTKGTLGSSYLTSILTDYFRELSADGILRSGIPAAAAAVPRITVDTLNLFNPTLNYKHFMIPALMVMLLTLICGFLPALNVVGEKETGTIEQINVTPVGNFTFIFAKLVPYWLIGLLILTICFALAASMYAFVPSGRFGVIYLFSFVFILAVSGFGLVISNYSNTLQQAMFVMFFFILVFVLMSGLFTPVHSMPVWARYITLFNPLRYFVEAMRGVYLRGCGIADLLPQLAALMGFAVVASVWAVRSYRKRQ